MEPFIVTLGLLLLTALFFVTGLLALRKMGFDQRNGPVRPGIRIFLVGIFCNTGLLIASIGVLFYAGYTPRDFGLALSNTDIIVMLGLVTAVVVLSGLFRHFPRSGNGFERSHGTSQNESSDATLGKSSHLDASSRDGAPAKRYRFHPGLFAISLLALTAGALQEEVIFRVGFWLEWASLGWPFALILSSVFFTAVHLITTGSNRWKLLSWFSGGVGLFVVYILSGSLWLVAIIHLARNVTNMLWLKPVPGISPLSRPVSDRKLGTSAVCMAMVQVLVCLFAYS
ncbi:MAG: CPBP family intramembrane metalloprotease [Leptospiraceae bacterium]|nr:CPBP family intramembrane metalloprotease [Leptospiraceae bacterium]MCB1306135.1 CPBP family intramembrane metalloprotease [Leptospiraceae bacterium]